MYLYNYFSFVIHSFLQLSGLMLDFLGEQKGNIYEKVSMKESINIESD